MDDIKRPFSPQEMLALYWQAVAYALLGTRWRDAVWLRRDMNEEAAKAVRQERKLQPKLKNTNGHKMSPINEKLSGVFFQIWDAFGGPTNSVYADNKLLVPVQSVLNPQEHNLYFADFYCQKVRRLDNRKIHYIILVVCRAGSPEDDFCKKRLVPVQWQSNPFVRIATSGIQQEFQFSMGDRNSAWYLVHLFFAHEIDLTQIPCQWGFADFFGDGQQSLELNDDCPHCKLAQPTSSRPANRG